MKIGDKYETTAGSIVEITNITDEETNIHIIWECSVFAKPGTKSVYSINYFNSHFHEIKEEIEETEDEITIEFL